MKFVILISILFSTTAHGEQAQPSTIPHTAAPKLTAEELQILNEGEVSSSSYVGGGVLGSILGFGIGHAVQGRYASTGVWFTAIEGISAALIGSSIGSVITTCLFPSTCNKDSSQTLALGLTVFGITRLIEIGELWIAPPARNKKVRELKEKQKSSGPTVAILKSSSGTLTYGLRWSF